MLDLMLRPNGNPRGLFGAVPSLGFDTDVVRTETGWTVEIPVPGFRPDQIDVTVEDRVLTVNGKTERRTFQRAIVLPEDVDVDAIAAKVEHGMLALTLNRHAKALPRKIDVKVVE